jgi:hypothetical protein
MAHITVPEAQAWAESSKLPIDDLDSELEASVAVSVLSRLNTVIDTSGWVDSTTTPQLIRKIIAMLYVSWVYNRTYSEDPGGTNEYALRLMGMAETLLSGVLDGSVEVIGLNISYGEPSFYPNDSSSLLRPNRDDPSLGGPQFTMGTIW